MQESKAALMGGREIAALVGGIQQGPGSPGRGRCYVLPSAGAAAPVSAADHGVSLGGLLPSGGWTSFRSQLQALARQKPSALGTGFFIGLRIAFWTSNSGMKALFWGHEHRLRGMRKTQLQARAQTDRANHRTLIDYVWWVVSARLLF